VHAGHQHALLRLPRPEQLGQAAGHRRALVLQLQVEVRGGKTSEDVLQAQRRALPAQALRLLPAQLVPALGRAERARQAGVVGDHQYAVTRGAQIELQHVGALL
jgi:hypothetical protein